VAGDVDIEALGLLDGLEGDARRERAELIAWLLDRGFEPEHIRATLGAPLMLPAYRVLGDDGDLVSAREICESMGIELDLLQRLQHAMGLPCIDDPDAAVLLRADGEAVAQAKMFLDLGIEPEGVIAVMRMLVDGLGHAAAIMREAAFKTILRPGSTEIELAEGSERVALRASPSLGPLLENLMRMVLRRSFEMVAVTGAERAAGSLPGARPVTVAFADMAGFTRLGETMSAEELERVARRLADLAHHAALAPVRFVKSIGDAVMLVSFEAAPLLSVLLELAVVAAADDLPPLRIGIASGLAVTRRGDWFGSPVNLASRVTAAARPGTVLVSDSARVAVGNAPGFAWSSAGTHHLKGVSDDVKLFRVARDGARTRG
jgi:adenylate cyclase